MLGSKKRVTDLRMCSEKMNLDQYTTPSLVTEEGLDSSISDVAIFAQSLSKCYQIYDKPYDRLKQSLYPRWQKFIRMPPKQYHREFWALKNVSIEIKKGETVGIIGRNGSGKSTLLQIICGTLTPTAGYVETNGRVAALLELGSGFNPEFTGRENVYLNGAILGLSRDEIDDRFDEIAAFADIGQFIEQPVKTFSSGMIVRLAFAVAINVDPQILVVDEALSVGDELFQRKCFSRIEAIKNSGASILFVTHSAGTVVELCDHAVLLDSGEQLAFGEPKHIVGQYQKLIYAPQDKCSDIRNQIRASHDGSQNSGMPRTVKAVSRSLECNRTVENDREEFFDPHLNSQSTLEYESNGAYIESPEILTVAGEKVNCLKRGKSYRYRYRIRFGMDSYDVRFGMLIKTMNGTELGGIGSSLPGFGIENIKAGEIATVSFDFKCELLAGMYFINAGCSGKIDGEEAFLHRIIDAVTFRVLTTNHTESRAGYIDFSAREEPFIIEFQK